MVVYTSLGYRVGKTVGHFIGHIIIWVLNRIYPLPDNGVRVLKVEADRR